MQFQQYRNGWVSIGQFTKRLFRLPSVLRPSERVAVGVLLIIAVSSWILSSWNSGGVNPAYGGTYTEGFVGQPKFVNPILATSDADRSLSKLIYSGLAKLDKDGNAVPDIADHWIVGDAAKTYTVYLRKDVIWHDGKPFTADDVVFTVNLIRDPAINSPYYDAWKDITIEAKDSSTVVFHLTDSSSVFPWFMTVGLLPSHLGRNAMNTSFIGTGWYKYSKVKMRNNQIETIILVRNSKHYANHSAYIDTIEFWFYDNAASAINALASQKILGLEADNPGAANAVKSTLNLSQQLTIFLNTGNPSLSDIKIRQKLLSSSDSFTTPLNLNLVLDKTFQGSPDIAEILNTWQKRNIKVTITADTLDNIRQNWLAKKTYAAIALSTEYGPQVDLYAYWHSSQADNGLNFTKLKNSDIDKLLTDLRKSQTPDSYNKIYSQVSELIDAQAVSMVVAKGSIDYWVAKSVHIIPANVGKYPADRFDTFDQWYIKTRR